MTSSSAHHTPYSSYIDRLVLPYNFLLRLGFNVDIQSTIMTPKYKNGVQSIPFNFFIQFCAATLRTMFTVGDHLLKFFPKMRQVHNSISFQI